VVRCCQCLNRLVRVSLLPFELCVCEVTGAPVPPVGNKQTPSIYRGLYIQPSRLYTRLSYHKLSLVCFTACM